MKAKWTDSKKHAHPRATIGVANNVAWRQAKKELNFILSKLQQKLGTPRPKVASLADSVFGNQLQACQAFTNAGIFADHNVFPQFIGTFLLASACQVSSTQLFDKHSRINLEGLMKKETCNACWKKIGDADLPHPAAQNRDATPTGMVPFWMKLELAFNSHSHALFTEGFPGEICVTVDDDKAHFNGIKCSAGLKTVRRVKCNCNGNTLHTAVFSCSMMPIQATWEREVNDSSQASTERMFHNVLTPMAAPGRPGDLSQVTSGKDRACWNKDWLHGHVMLGGGKIKAAAAKRQLCIVICAQNND